MLLVETIDGFPVLSPNGRFDAYLVPAIDSTMETIFKDNDKPQVIVNLMQVHFIDAAAVAALEKWNVIAKERGGEIKLASLRQTVRMRLDIQHLARFMIYEDNTQAIEAFQADNPDE
jgi:anti-anti-sigma factor